MRISDLLREPKRQSNVNLYLSSFPGEKVCFHTQICKLENAKKMHRGSFGFSEYPLGKERAVKELISGNDVSSLHDFEILRFVTYVHLPFSVGSLDFFCRFTRVYEGHFMLCFKEEFKVE